MPLRNVPITYTLDQQRQEINSLASDVNNIDVSFDEKVDDRVAALVQGGIGTAVTYDDANGSLTIDLAFNEFSTSSILEGTNLYYTEDRANAAIDARVNQNFANNLNITNLGPQDSITLTLGQTTRTITPLNYNNTSWDTAYGWGDHSAVGYLTSYTETSTLDNVLSRGDSSVQTASFGTVKSDVFTSQTGSTNLSLTGNNIIATADLRVGTIDTSLSNDYGVRANADGEVIINHSPTNGGLTLKSGGNSTFTVDNLGRLNGVVKFVTSDGSAGQSLQTDGSGQLVWGEGGGANVEVSDNPPSGATSGDMWWESDSGRLKVYYDNGSNPAAWVDASPPLKISAPNSAFVNNTGNLSADSPSDPIFEDTNGIFNATIQVSTFTKTRISVLLGSVTGSNNTNGTIILQRVVGATTTDICTVKCPDPSVTGIIPIAFDFIDLHGLDTGDNVTYQLSLTLNVSGTRTVAETSQLFVTEI
jgi:hypothetical protein